MSKHGDIVSWLSSVDCSPDFPPAPANDAKRKRDREQQQEPPSPPASESIHRHLHHHSDMSQGGPPTPKKRRLAHGLSGDGDGDREEDDEQQETPKASDKSSILQTQFRQPASPLKRTPRQRHHQPQLQSHGKPASVSSLSSLSESQHSSASGRSSPTKKIAALELNPDGLETRMLSLTNLLMPPALADMLAEMEGCGAGAGVVSRARKDDITAQSQTDRSFSTFQDFMYGDPTTRDALGPTPSVADVAWILEEARECQDAMHSEAGWNMSVHFPLLRMAIYGSKRRRQLVGTAPCTTARIIREYLPTDSHSKMIDFAIFLAPDNQTPSAANTAALAAIHGLRRVLPCGVINHTDYLPFRDRPLAVSIETKTYGSGGMLHEASLQTGTWHAAQWSLLSRLAGQDVGDDDRGAARPGLDDLPFLPALVVQGHEWSFAASTREGGKTILWLDRGFGSTTSAAGVYKIFWGLQRLARWSEDVYWPWFKQCGLGL